MTEVCWCDAVFIVGLCLRLSSLCWATEKWRLCEHMKQRRCGWGLCSNQSSRRQLFLFILSAYQLSSCCSQTQTCYTCGHIHAQKCHHWWCVVHRSAGCLHTCLPNDGCECVIKQLWIQYIPNQLHCSSFTHTHTRSAEVALIFLMPVWQQQQSSSICPSREYRREQRPPVWGMWETIRGWKSGNKASIQNWWKGSWKREKEQLEGQSAARCLLET